MSDPPSRTLSLPSSSQPVLDYVMFPHIVEQVLSHLDIPTAIAVRATCRRLRDCVEKRLFEHILVTAEDMKTKVELRSPSKPFHRLPFVPYDLDPIPPRDYDTDVQEWELDAAFRQKDQEDYEASLLTAAGQSRKCQLALTRVVDWAGEPTLNPRIRLTNELQSVHTIRRNGIGATVLPDTYLPVDLAVDWVGMDILGDYEELGIHFPEGTKRYHLHAVYDNQTRLGNDAFSFDVLIPNSLDEWVIVMEPSEVGENENADADSADAMGPLPTDDLTLDNLGGLTGVGETLPWFVCNGGKAVFVGFELVDPRILGMQTRLRGLLLVDEIRRLINDYIRRLDHLWWRNRIKPQFLGKWGDQEQNDAIARVSFLTLDAWRASNPTDLLINAKPQYEAIAPANWLINAKEEYSSSRRP